MMMRKNIIHILMGILVCCGAIACTPMDAVDVARVAADPASAGRVAAEKAARYALDPRALAGDLKRFAEMLERFRRAVDETWGKDDAREPTTTDYVKYTHNYLSRATVEFDRGIITVETVDEDAPRESLKNAIVTTVLTPEDPRAVDLYSASAVSLGAEPFLFREVRDFDGKHIRWMWRAERFADELIKRNLTTRPGLKEGAMRLVRYVQFPMVADHLELRARKYAAIVKARAREYDISGNLIFAIMKTESDFNPFAVSRAPAFGLMQIVPTTAGRDVYTLIHGRDGAPSRTELFDPPTNIRYGSAYLHLLSARYLRTVTNKISREYCVIAAYNAGAGAVLRTFHADRDHAPDVINALSPGEVYSQLRHTIPKEETRRYLVKVIEAKKDFVNF